jgi:hypothetical protein
VMRRRRSRASAWPNRAPIAARCPVRSSRRRGGAVAIGRRTSEEADGLGGMQRGLRPIRRDGGRRRRGQARSGRCAAGAPVASASATGSEPASATLKPMTGCMSGAVAPKEHAGRVWRGRSTGTGPARPGSGAR